MNNIDLNKVDEREFRELVKNDCFQWEHDNEVAQWLRSDAVVEQTLVVLQTLATNLTHQLAGYNERVAAGEQEPDDDWRIRTLRLKRAVEARIPEIRAKVRDLHRRQHDSGPDTFTRLLKLRYAIANHREAVLSEDYEPTPADLELWAIVDQDDQTKVSA